MKYYTSINSWNLLESFVTESLSPFTFYKERNFGNNLSRFINTSNEKINFLILSTTDIGGEYTIEIDDSILDKDNIKPIKNLKTTFTYGKTIYYKVGFVKFRFASEDLLDALISESQILFEVKCIEKYKSSFFVKEVKEKKTSVTLQRLGETFSFERQTFINNDNKFNLIKGAIVGYACGELTTFGLEDQRLIIMIKDIKNSFAGLNTQIMVNDIDVLYPEKFTMKLQECKKLYFDILKEKTNNFDILTQLFCEIKSLVSLRVKELSEYKSDDWKLKYEKMISQKQDLENQIFQIEIDNDILSIKKELQQIKDQERLMGESQGKTRIYFKKGTPEYDNKLKLKEKLETFEETNDYYKSLLVKLDRLNQSIIDSTNGKSQYDNAISALFLRISDIINDLQKKVQIGKTLNEVNLVPINIAADGILILNDLTIEKSEIEFFNTLLKIIINRDTLEPISDFYILSLVERAANEYKFCETATTEKGQILIECLREFWKYKNNLTRSFNIPIDMPVLQSIMSFFLKPFGYDQIERFMMNKKYTKKKYAMMLWAACNGYAALPKTFTAILYQENVYYSEMDNLLQKAYDLL